MKKKISLSILSIVGIVLLSGLVGVIITICVKLPIQFDPTIDLAMLISVASFIAAITIIPLAINRFMADNASKSSIIVADVCNITDLLSQLRSLYEDKYFSDQEVMDEDRKRVLSLVRRISNSISSLKAVVSADKRYIKFNDNVIEFFEKEVRTAITEKFDSKKKIEEIDHLAAIEKIDKLTDTLSKIKYITYS